MQFILLLLAGFLFGKLFAYQAFKFQKRITKKTFLGKFHFHHSLVGILIVLFGVFIAPSPITISLVGFGSGLSLHHFLTEGFRFITTNE